MITPILLLSIIELVQKGEIINNRIEITPELVLEFKNNWSKLVTSQHHPNFALPFFHMKSEPFWKLVTKTGMILPGIVNNITNFGCFVDLGIKESGLVHISQLKAGFVSDVNEVVKLHQHVQVKVTEVDEDRKRIQLSMVL